MKTSKGSMLLRVASILLIIAAVYALALDVLVFVAYGDAYAQAGFGLTLVLAIVAVLVALLQLVSGILGVLFWKKPERAGLCIILGIAMLAFAIIFSLYNIVYAAGTLTVMNYVSYASSVVLPVLYLVGGLLLRKKAA